MVREGSRKNIYSLPSNLTILTAHTYDIKPIFEVNMDFLGIDYISLDVDKTKKWAMTTKLKAYCDFIKSGNCNTEYVLTADTNDVIFLGNPNNIIDVFNSKNCDLFFCSTYYDSSYVVIPEIREQIDLLRWVDVPKRERKYLNGGVFVAKTDSSLDILEHAVSYIDDSVWEKSFAEYLELRDISISLRDFFDGYPYGVPSDQDIFRYIEPEYHSRIVVDVDDECIIRHSTKSLVNWFSLNTEILN